MGGKVLVSWEREKWSDSFWSPSFCCLLHFCQCWRSECCKLEACMWHEWRPFASPANVGFSPLFRISSQCPAGDYGCSSTNIYSGGKTSRVHASIHSDFPAASMSRHSRSSASSYCYNGPSCDLLCKLCQWIHPHKSGHSRRSSWSCRSSVGLSWWPSR